MQIAQLGPYEQGYSTGVVHASSLDEHRALTAELWEVELEPLARGTFSSKTVFLTTPRMAIYQERWNRPLRVRGALRSGQVVFALPTQHGLPFHMAGRTARPGKIPWLPDSRRCDVISEASYKNLLVVFDAAFLLGIAAKLQHPFAEAAFMTEAPWMLQAEPHKAVALRQRIETLLTGLQQRPAGRTVREVRSSRLDERVADALLDSFFIDVAARNRDGELGSFMQRYRMAALCMEFARSRGYDVTVPELCALIGKSRRTLEYAFREVTGTSPARYLRFCRLQQVRQVLSAARPEEETVTTVATRWGFFELGRFAGVYRAHFGELPSQTLSRRPRQMESIPAPRTRTARPHGSTARLTRNSVRPGLESTAMSP